MPSTETMDLTGFATLLLFPRLHPKSPSVNRSQMPGTSYKIKQWSLEETGTITIDLLPKSKEIFQREAPGERIIKVRSFHRTD